MAKCMDFRLVFWDRLQTILTTDMRSCVTLIHYSMRDQDIHRWRDQVPVSLNLRPTLSIKCPIKKGGLNGRPPKEHIIDVDPRSIQVVYLSRAQYTLGFVLTVIFQSKIMIVCEHNFMLIFERGNILCERFYFRKRTRRGKIAAAN